MTVLSKNHTHPNEGGGFGAWAAYPRMGRHTIRNMNLPYYDILIVFNFYKDALQSWREELIHSSKAIDEHDLFFNIVGGKRKSTIYGLGSQAS